MAVFTRQQFYELVWSKSGMQLGKELGVSYLDIMRKCQEHQIPRPSEKNWKKIERGEAVTRPALPEIDNPRLDQVTVQPVAEWQREEPIADETARRIDEEKLPAKKIVVPETLESPHRLVAKTLRALKTVKSDDQGLLHTAGNGCLDVSIGRDSLDRGMRILDALVKAIESRGMTITIASGSSHWTTLIEVDGEAIALRLTENLAERPRQLPKEEKERYAKMASVFSHELYEKYPRGALTLTAKAKDDEFMENRWSELHGSKLEGRLNSIVGWLYRCADRLKERRRRFAMRDQYFKDEERRRVEADVRRREEEERSRQLDAQITAWERAEKLRIFAKAVEDAFIAKHGSVAAGSNMEKWLGWVRSKASEVDPIRF